MFKIVSSVTVVASHVVLIKKGSSESVDSKGQSLVHQLFQVSLKSSLGDGQFPHVTQVYS